MSKKDKQEHSVSGLSRRQFVTGAGLASAALLTAGGWTDWEEGLVNETCRVVLQKSSRDGDHGDEMNLFGLILVE